VTTVARRRRGFGSDDDGEKFTVLCYFTRILSTGLDEAKSFTSEPDALKFAKKTVKESHGANPHCLVNNAYGGHKTVGLTKTRRLQVK